MPLLKGSSPDIISQNIKELRSTGKYSEKQCTAIAMKTARKGSGKKLQAVINKVVKE